MKRISFLLLLSLFFLACSYKSKKENDIDSIAAVKSEIIDVDRSFSRLSELKGLKVAYIEYIDSNGVLLRPNAMPLSEGNAMDFISRSDDTTFTMTWEPESASVDASGDFGYSYGIFSLKQNNEDSIHYGTYVTIWKRQPGGRWKFVLHSGNEGIK